MRKRLWDLAKSRIEIGTILPGHRHKVSETARAGGAAGRVAARRLHWAAAAGRRHWRQPLALSAYVARRGGTYVQTF